MSTPPPWGPDRSVAPGKDLDELITRREGHAEVLLKLRQWAHEQQALVGAEANAPFGSPDWKRAGLTAGRVVAEAMLTRFVITANVYLDAEKAPPEPPKPDVIDVPLPGMGEVA